MTEMSGGTGTVEPVAAPTGETGDNPGYGEGHLRAIAWANDRCGNGWVENILQISLL